MACKHREAQSKCLGGPVIIVRGVCCVSLEFIEAALMEIFTPVSCRLTKCAMRIACVHSGALRALLCIQGDVRAHFAGRREVGIKFPAALAAWRPARRARASLETLDRLPKHSRQAEKQKTATEKKKTDNWAPGVSQGCQWSQAAQRARFSKPAAAANYFFALSFLIFWSFSGR